MLQWAQSAHCVLCDAHCTEQQTICAACAASPATATCVLQLRRNTAERQLDAIERHCMRCAGVHERQVAAKCLALTLTLTLTPTLTLTRTRTRTRTLTKVAAKCRSLDCPHLYTRLKLSRQLSAATGHFAQATAALSTDLDF
jgi:hypothetical protein